MEPDFWHQRWQQGQIGFHEGRPNARFVSQFPVLGLSPGARVFVPLCGKTRDIGWLLSQGFRVAGAELSEIAVRDLFADLGTEPVIADAGPLRRYAAPGIDIFAGDIFALTAKALDRVDAIYDRAALVALPPELRDLYAPHLVALTGGAPQLLVCFEYDESLMQGPPFSISGDEVARLYADHYGITLLDAGDALGAARGTPATESIWHLRPTA